MRAFVNVQNQGSVLFWLERAPRRWCYFSLEEERFVVCRWLDKSSVQGEYLETHSEDWFELKL